MSYKQELSSFFNEKRKQDAKFKKALKRRTSFKEKQDYIKSYRDISKLEEGSFKVDNNHQFERKRFIRDIFYLDNLNKELKEKYDIFNQFKHDVLYELVDMNEEQYDTYDLEIIELKQRRDEYISKRTAKQNEINSKIVEYNIKINEKMDEYYILEDRKEIYKQIIELKKNIFEILEPKLSVLNIDGVNTVVTDYLQIKGNERNLQHLNNTVEVSFENLDENDENESKSKNKNKSESEHDSKSERDSKSESENESVYHVKSESENESVYHVK